MKKLVSIIGLIAFFGVHNSNGQSIWTNPITGTSPGLTSPYTTGDVVSPNITVSGISRGAGLTGNAGNDRYNANSFNTAGIDLTAYFEFTLTPDPGCEIDFTSFVYTGQASGTGPTSFAFRSSVDGFVANIGTPNAAGTTINLSGAAYQNITTAITFRFYGWGASAAGGTFSINDFTFNGAITCGCSGPVGQPTTETTADTATPSCTSATIAWTASTTADNVIVVVSTGVISSTPSDGTAYTASANYGSGETIGANQFVVYNGSGTSITVSGLTANTTYNYAIFGFDGAVADCEENYLTGGNFGSFTTLNSCDQAQITSLMINSCNGINEGTDELIIIENGDNAINVDDMTIDLPNTTWCNSGCGTNTIVNNATYLADLNTMAGCVPDLFVYSTTIPAGATIIIFTGDPPSTTLDYSANCGAPNVPIYALFLNNISITGNFANSGSTPKDVTIDFGNGDSDAVSYIPDDADQNDGGSVLFDAAGNPTYYTSTDCVYPLEIRNIELKADFKSSFVEIAWSGIYPSGTTKVIIERAENDVDFYPIEKLSFSLNETTTLQNNYYDFKLVESGIIYYRLKFIDENGLVQFSEIVSVNLNGYHFYSENNQLKYSGGLDLKSDQNIQLFNLSGKLIFSGTINQIDECILPENGIYLIVIDEISYQQKLIAL